MKCKIPEISWHNRDPVLSIDIQLKSAIKNIYRLATGGTDSHVLIWYLSFAANGVELDLELAADLTRHQRAVNVVRWSPDGELLASGDDESVIFLWKQKSDSEPLNVLDSVNEQNKEIWLVYKILRGHMEDVYDLSWAPNSQHLISGSVDNTAMLWDVHKGRSTAILRDHKGYVQGVAWDPKDQYLATLSTDRYLRIFNIQTRRVLHKINKGSLPVPESHELSGRVVSLFHDDTLQTFFRRLCFTPDGKLLLTPSGKIDYEGAGRSLNTVYAFSRYDFQKPALALPCPNQYTVAVRCCPQLYRLRPHDSERNPPMVPLPYRMIFAVATRSSVYFYDTQQKQPFGLISNIHYTRLTDLTWSMDGRIVAVSSTDGFCSLITFEDGELGEIYEGSEEVLCALVTSSEKLSKTKKFRKNKENHPSLRKSSKLDHSDEVDTTNNSKEKKQSKGNNDAEKLSTDEEEPSLSGSDEGILPSKQREQKQKIATIKNRPTKALPIEIIIDKEILSSDEKFESPEKKHSSATPITIRRHPRSPKDASIEQSLKVLTPKSSSAVKTIAGINNFSPQTCSAQRSPSCKGQATPIAVRRTPRVLISPTSQSATLVEEAMDVELSVLKEKVSPAGIEQTGDDLTTNSELCREPRTENTDNSSRVATEKATTLVDDQQEAPAHDAQVEIVHHGTPKASMQGEDVSNNKTPRRVALKTISTPKSKKKLID